ncbi:hypothetical protein Dimus_020855, partial [Dionaea muscipula]
LTHALEKTKYEDSDVNWKEKDPKYHFSCQYTADIIAMNALCSRFHHHKHISRNCRQDLKNLCHILLHACSKDALCKMRAMSHIPFQGYTVVVSGINVLDPKFNIASPEQHQSIYFPFTHVP